MANGFDLNSRTSRIKAAVAGFDQLDMLTLSTIVLRFLIYLGAAILYHDYDEKLFIAVAFIEAAVTGLMFVKTFKRDVIISSVIRLIGEVLLAGAGLMVVWVNGIVSEYLRDVQKRESVIVMLVVFNILLVIAQTARTLFAMDVMLAASTSKHRKTITKEFKQRIRPKVQLISMILCFCLLTIPSVLIGSIVSSLDSVKVDTRIYQVVKSEYVLYDYPATVRKQGTGTVITDKNDQEKALAETPLYFGQDTATEKILVPRTYALLQPAISSTKRVDNLSIIEHKNGTYNVSSESGTREASDFFLYDGRDTYIFFEETPVTIGDNEIRVSPFSYLTAVSNGSLTLFDPGSASCMTYSLIGRDAYAVMRDGTKIDVGTNILIKTDGTEQMLFMNPANLSEFIG